MRSVTSPQNNGSIILKLWPTMLAKAMNARNMNKMHTLNMHNLIDSHRQRRRF